MAKRKSKLTAQQKKTLRCSYRESLQRIFIDHRSYFNQYFENGRWIGVSNKYCNNTEKKLLRDTKSGSSNVNHKQLSQYILVSAPLHCVDGWSYLGRSIDCLNRNDTNTARHLAYYAELRGAMALLASEGIGIFSNRHFILDKALNCNLLPKSKARDGRKVYPGTHEITWLALEHWAERKGSTQLLEEIISPGGIRLSDWLDSFGFTSKRLLGNKWLLSWGLDLKRLSDDREARNEASYRPTRLITRASLDALSCSEFTGSFWTLYAPFGDSRFEILDRHLLRLTLEHAYFAISGNKPKDDLRNYEIRIENMLSNIIPVGATPGGLSQNLWKDFLTRKLDANTPIPFIEASGTDPVTHARHHLQVIARASLLLRVATGACAKLIEEMGLTSVDLKFWWKSLGEDFGLWESGIDVEQFTDLWADIASALEGITNWTSVNIGTQKSFARWQREKANEIFVLGGCERIALWGLGL